MKMKISLSSVFIFPPKTAFRRRDMRPMMGFFFRFSGGKLFASHFSLLAMLATKKTSRKTVEALMAVCALFLSLRFFPNDFVWCGVRTREDGDERED